VARRAQVLDPLGGASFRVSYRLLAPLGRLVIYGVSAISQGERRNWWHAARAIMQMRPFKPLSLIKKTNMDFGTLITSATAGTATINPVTGVLTTTGGVTPVPGGVSPAVFLGAGSRNARARAHAASIR